MNRPVGTSTVGTGNDMDTLRVPRESTQIQLTNFRGETTASRILRGLGYACAMGGPNLTQGVSFPNSNEGGETTPIPHVLGE
jgi:hypothetical protein